jgi:hypothetical protein
VTLLLAQITGCVSVERPAEKEKEKEKIIVVPEKNSTTEIIDRFRKLTGAYAPANRPNKYFIEWIVQY